MTLDGELLKSSSDNTIKKVEFPTRGMLCIGDDGVILDANSEAVKILGHNTPAAIEDKTIFEYMLPRDIERAKAELQAALEQSTTRTAYLTIKWPMDELVKMELSFTPWLNDVFSKQLIVILNVINIIPSKDSGKGSNYEHALESLKNIVGVEPDGEHDTYKPPSNHNILMFTIDENGLCLSWNKYCEKYFGFEYVEVVNKKSIYDLIDSAQSGGLGVVLRSALSAGKEFRADIKIAPGPGYDRVRLGHIIISKCMEYCGKKEGYVCLFKSLEQNEEVYIETPSSEAADTAAELLPESGSYPAAETAANPKMGAEHSTQISADGGSIGVSTEIFQPPSGYNDFAIVTSDGGIKFMTENFIHQLGFSSFDELREHKWFEFMDDNPSLEMFKNNQRAEVPYRTKEGSIVELDLQIIPIEGKYGGYREALWLLNTNDGRRELEKPSCDPGPTEHEMALLQLNHDLTAVNTIASLIEQSSSINDLKKSVMDTIISTVSVEYGGMYLLVDDKLHLVYSYGLPSGIAPIQVKNPEDLQKITELTNEVFESYITQKIQSSVTIPIQAHGETFGFIALACASDTEFNKMDMDLINTITHQFAGSLHRENLFYDYKLLYDEYRDFYDNSPDIYITVDSSGVIRACNETAYNILGESRLDMLNSNLLEYLKSGLKDQYANFNKWFNDAFKVKKIPDFDLRLTTDNGGYYYFNIKAVRVQALNSKCRDGLRLTLHEITDGEKIKSYLQNSNKLMEQVLNAADDVIIYLDQNRRVIECNNSVAKVLGYDRQELISQPINILYANELLMERYFKKMNEVYTNSTEVKQEQVVRRKNGSMFVANVTSCPVTNKDGDTTGMVLYFSDITERKREEKEYFEAKKESSFYINILSHDITNYNQCAMSYIELLMQTVTEEKYRNYLDIIMDQLESSTKLSNNIQKLSEIKDAKPKLTTIDLGKIIRSTAHSLLEKSHKGNDLGRLEINFLYPEGIYGVKADILIEELFSNLFLNCVKHNTHENKKIDIKITKPQDGGDVYWQIEIADNAFGIPDEYKSSIFNSQAFSKNFGNKSGLGLTIIKALVERYGGRIWVENRVEDDYKQGSIFKILLKKDEMPIEQAVYGVGARA